MHTSGHQIFAEYKTFIYNTTTEHKQATKLMNRTATKTAPENSTASYC